MAVVTISRQYGTGGVRISRGFAEKMGWKFIFREDLVQACRDRGLDIDLERFEGRAPSIMERLAGMNRQKLRDTLGAIMNEAADAGNVVIAGWGGQVLLKNRKDALHLRIVGPAETRTRQLMDSSGVTRSQAEEIVRRADRDQRMFSDYFFGVDFNDPKLYHAMLNIEQCGEETIRALVAAMLPEIAAAAS